MDLLVLIQILIAPNSNLGINKGVIMAEKSPLEKKSFKKIKL